MLLLILQGFFGPDLRIEQGKYGNVWRANPRLAASIQRPTPQTSRADLDWGIW